MILGTTKSLCPWCLKRIEAERIFEGDSVYLRKVCPEHGECQTVLWRGTADSFMEWGANVEGGESSAKKLTSRQEDCPFDCGLCPAHTGGACVVLLEVTNRCNVSCPICFSNAGKGEGREPDLATIEGLYKTIIASGGPFPVQLSGGEPAMRDDLPDIVALGKQLGFSLIQINTNGIRFAEDPGFLSQVKKSGASTLYLQFDGVTDDVHLALRGSALVDIKTKVIENCATIGLGVVLVPVLVPGINDQQIGDIIRFAKKWMPVVRGVHFQPISYFGRYPSAPRDADRITLPEVLRALEQQTNGEVKAADFKPKRNKEGHCSFAGVFMLGDDGVLKSSFSKGMTKDGREPDTTVRQFLQTYWSSVEKESCCSPAPCQISQTGTFTDDLMNWMQSHSLTISGMPFQDVWNIDLDRLEGCCIHVVTTDNRLIPFCARYVTDIGGNGLYQQ